MHSTHSETQAGCICDRYLNDMVSHFQRPIWLTETACPNDGGALATQISYMRGALDVLDAMPGVERCATLLYLALDMRSVSGRVHSTRCSRCLQQHL